jgi:hypothetical protein
MGTHSRFRMIDELLNIIVFIFLIVLDAEYVTRFLKQRAELATMKATKP